MPKTSASLNSCYDHTGNFDSLHLFRKLRRSMGPSDSAMLLLGFVLVFGAASGKSATVDNWFVHIHEGTLHRVTAINQTSDHLDLSAFPVKNLAPNCFAGVHGLKNLILQIKVDEYQFKQHLPPLVFRFLSDLEYLSLANSHIQKMEYAFWGLSNLRVLDLRNSNINLDRGSLFGIGNTTKILLAGSNVPSVQPKHFLETDPLVGLCMHNGIVQSLDLFQNMINMTQTCNVHWVQMYYNQLHLHSMGIRKFQKGWYRITGVKVYLLAMVANRITDLSRNLINDLPKDLQILSLAWNRIRSVEKRKIDNPYLRVLDLTGNPVVKIDPTAFARTKLKELVLTFDFMKYLPRTLESVKLFQDHEKRKYTLTTSNQSSRN